MDAVINDPHHDTEIVGAPTTNSEQNKLVGYVQKASEKAKKRGDANPDKIKVTINKRKNVETVKVANNN